jgi:hypothetical protein
LADTEDNKIFSVNQQHRLKVILIKRVPCLFNDHILVFFVIIREFYLNVIFIFAKFSLSYLK